MESPLVSFQAPNVFQPLDLVQSPPDFENHIFYPGLEIRLSSAGNIWSDPAYPVLASFPSADIDEGIHDDIELNGTSNTGAALPPIVPSLVNGLSGVMSDSQSGIPGCDNTFSELSDTQELPKRTSNQINSCLCIACIPTLDYCYIGSGRCCSARCGTYIDGLYHQLCRYRFLSDSDYCCIEPHCLRGKKSFKRFSDLKGHYKTTHCTKPKEFTCHVLGCKYRTNGFARKDKLTSHIKNAHAGRGPSGPQHFRNLRPAGVTESSVTGGDNVVV